MVTIIKERLQQFGQAYEDLEPGVLGDLIVATGEWLETLTGPELADGAMTALHQQLLARTRGSADDQVVVQTGWRTLWRDDIDLSDLAQLDAAQHLTGLNAFAFWGLPMAPQGSIAEREAEIARTISAMRALLEAAPSGWADLAAAEVTVAAAEARFRLDHDEAIMPEQLAALARVSLKSVKNLLAPSSGSGVSLDADGKIPAPAALAWLTGRGGFRSSVWREELSDDSDEEASPEAQDLGEVVFVPEARDGSWFDPRTCRRAGGYTIGPKGDERTVENYLEALRQLARMPVPYWRRPNSAGNWGIVAGMPTWLRKPARDLGLG
ncbi:hypothetical protein JL100_030235 (plasmid) [Skermanella mucosa]|uniref:hypothetical protein n=1 Tax=Skermanella mucosa TaxID=1789672 RepID=UPI00192B618B|nr:hypothetical protein [Skermanella mucosa]UEM24511.1 hypothetical protein JL100_030235 [Skermanella mucosa]